MPYASIHSKMRIVHRDDCRYVKAVSPENERHFYTLRKAASEGFVHCLCCAPMQKYLRKEKDALDSFCKRNGLFYSFNRSDGSLDVISRTGKWKIIVNGQKDFIWLYHKSLFRQEDSFVPGYHSQNVRKSTLLGYLQYVAAHDGYRKEEPLYDFQKRGTGRQCRRDQERQAKKIRRKQSIIYVTELLNGMSKGVIAY